MFSGADLPLVTHGLAKPARNMGENANYWIDTIAGERDLCDLLRPKLLRVIGMGRLHYQAKSCLRPRSCLKRGYFPSVDHAVPPDVPFDNYRHYIELMRDIAGSEKLSFV